MSHSSNHIRRSDRQDTRRVLIIDNLFPPSRVGNDRIIKFVRYLPESGWQPMVLTVSLAGIEEHDRSLMEQVPSDLPIVRAFYPNLFAWMARREEKKKRRGPLWRLFGALVWQLRRFAYCPEDLVVWYPFAVRAGVKACREFRPNAILSTAPFYVNHMVARSLSRKTGLPWLSDYRNLWTDSPNRRSPTSFHHGVEDRLYRRLLGEADEILVIAESMKEQMLKRHTFLKPDRISCIENGFDRGDFEGLSTSPADGPFTLAHTGNVYPGYPMKALFQAIAKVKKGSGPEKLRVRFVGEIYEGMLPEVRGMMDEMGIRDMVEIRGRVDRRESLEIQRSAHALLFLYGSSQPDHSETVIGGKLYDYLAAHRPILAVCPPGASADLVAQSGHGWVGDPANPAALFETLTTWIEAAPDSLENLIQTVPSVVSRYDRRAQCRVLAGILSRLSESREQ